VSGKVFLVGAGPGSVDLLTLRAVRVIERADVVLYDALIGPDILQLVRPNARLINVGKRCGKKALSQADINALLVYWARSGDTVVRLKGGDPGIFGRAAEETEALRSAGIAFEVVPGVTAACSAAAAAGISLTDRHVASQVVFATAHHSEENAARSFASAAREGRTLVLYMPGQDYEHIYRELRHAGLAADTPCVVVSKIAAPDQQVTWSTLHSLAEHHALPSPSVLIIGEVARRPGAIASDEMPVLQWAVTAQLNWALQEDEQHLEV
jgi:uroporphyrin-III C-methyltransferase